MEPTTWNSVLLRETHSRVRKMTHTRVGTALGMMGRSKGVAGEVMGITPGGSDVKQPIIRAVPFLQLTRTRWMLFGVVCDPSGAQEPYYLWQYTRRHSLAPLTLATKLATLLSSP
jgi:hypothetical protein